jgi:hypothetical protein
VVGHLTDADDGRVNRQVDDGVRAELRERLGRPGYESNLDAALRASVGVEKLEEWLDGIDRINPVVLEQCRQR